MYCKIASSGPLQGFFGAPWLYAGDPTLQFRAQRTVFISIWQTLSWKIHVNSASPLSKKSFKEISFFKDILTDLLYCIYMEITSRWHLITRYYRVEIYNIHLLDVTRNRSKKWNFRSLACGHSLGSESNPFQGNFIIMLILANQGNLDGALWKVETLHVIFSEVQSFHSCSFHAVVQSRSVCWLTKVFIDFQQFISTADTSLEKCTLIPNVADRIRKNIMDFFVSFTFIVQGKMILLIIVHIIGCQVLFVLLISCIYLY